MAFDMRPCAYRSVTCVRYRADLRRELSGDGDCRCRWSLSHSHAHRLRSAQSSSGWHSGRNAGVPSTDVSLHSMPPSARGGPCDFPPSAGAEFCGARRAALQTAQPSERGRMGIYVHWHFPSLDNREPFGGCATLRARASDLVHIRRFPEFLLRITDQTTTAYPHFYVVRFSLHA